ncbi:hypothetical protein HDV64DRAFT_150916 [Trichoderma sp. TUCIM 5745]
MSTLFSCKMRAVILALASITSIRQNGLWLQALQKLSWHHPSPIPLGMYLRYPTAARDTEIHLHEHSLHCAIWPFCANIGQVNSYVYEWARPVDPVVSDYRQKNHPLIQTIWLHSQSNTASRFMSGKSLSGIWA